MQFIDSSTFMASSLSNLVDNLAEGIHKLKQKHGYDDKKKKCKTCGIKYKDHECFLECINVKDDLILYRCLCYNNNYQKEFHKNLKKRYMITISLFFYCKKVFTYMNMWMICKNAMKHHYRRKNIFTVTCTWKILLMQIIRTQKEFVKILK